MALTPLQVTSVCYSGSYKKRCKYLDHRLRKDGEFVSVCTKLHVGAYEALVKRRKDEGEKEPSGDNCKGYLLLLYKEQGM